MKRAFKYRIYPTDEQKEYLEKVFMATRFWWNYCLKKRKTVYEETGKSISAQYDIARELPILKKEEKYSFLNIPPARSLLSVCQNLDSAYARFFKGIAEFPKFKKSGYSNSYTISLLTRDQSIDCIKEKNGFIKIPKIGFVRIVLHRRLSGKPKSFTISKKSFDYYEISILCDDVFTKIKKEKPSIDKSIGIDMGVKSDSNAVLSDGTKFSTSERDKKLEKRLKRLQKRLKKKKWIETGEKKFSHKHNKDVDVKVPSKNYIKLKDKIAKLYNKISSRRNYNTHQITSYITKKPASDVNTICIENLNVKGMVKNHNLATAITNANMGEMRRQLEYKSDWYGKNLSVIDRFYPSSQTCSNCGYVNKEIKNLKIRMWTCPECGTEHDRDVNAAINIKNEGYRILTA